MENYWIFYALGGLLLLGIGDFIKKIIIQKGANKDIFLFICFVFYVIFLTLNFLLFGNTNFNDPEINGALFIGVFDAFTIIGVMAAFKYLDISFALVFIRVISSIGILIIGMNLLGDNLSFSNIIGFFMGIVAIFLLSGFKFGGEKKVSSKGLLAASGTTIGLIGSHSYFKYIVADINIDNFMFLKFSVTFIFIIIYMFFRNKFKEFTKEQVSLVIPLAFLTVVMFLFQFLYFLPNIYLNGPLSLSYKILSYSIIIPIILSIIFYKDKITKRRIVAFILTLVSLGLFIV